MQTAPAPRHTTFGALFDALLGNVEHVIQGKREPVRLALVCLFAEGHLLIEDVPGVGKTSMAKALARSIDGTWSRIQFTPDLLPSDVTGVSVWNRVANEFEFRPGGVFADVVLADEINRASPKTQSALLESMEEHQVTVDSRTYALPRPFLVIATQNPVELEGTFALPEAQLDRFLVRVVLGYPQEADERAIARRYRATDEPLEAVRAVMDPAALPGIRDMTRQVVVSAEVEAYLVRIVRATRAHADLQLGASPRASVALYRAAQASALLEGRDFVLPDDVSALAEPVLTHRLVVDVDRELRGATAGDVIGEVLDGVSVGVGTGAR